MKLSLPGVHNIKRMFTTEDHIGPIYNVHKILGLACLLHYIVRALPQNNMERSWGTLLMYTLHVVLSCSSFIFKVPMERVVGVSTIWKEMQIHNCIFVSRAYFVFLLVFFRLNSTWTCLAVVIFWHILGDLTTFKYGSEAMGTTIRGSRNFDGLGYWYEMLEDLGMLFSSSAQIYAIYVLITVGEDNLVYPLFTMVPIQLSSLFGTMVRKGVISSQLNNIMYVICIIIPIYMKYHWKSISKHDFYYFYEMCYKIV